MLAKRGRPPKNSTPDLDDLVHMFHLWNKALESKNGIAIASDKPNRLAQRLYTARRESGLNIYNGLKVVETETEVWIKPR